MVYCMQLANSTEPEQKRKKKCFGLLIQTDKGNMLIEIFPNNVGLECNSFYI